MSASCPTRPTGLLESGHSNSDKLPFVAKSAAPLAYRIAAVYAWRGEKDQAFEWLERAYRQRDGALAGVKMDLLFESLHGDPRFKALLMKMNFPE